MSLFQTAKPRGVPHSQLDPTAVWDSEGVTAECATVLAHRYLHNSDFRKGCVLVVVLSAQASRLFLDIAVHHSNGILPSVFPQLDLRQEFEIGGCGVGD